MHTYTCIHPESKYSMRNVSVRLHVIYLWWSAEDELRSLTA